MAHFQYRHRRNHQDTGIGYRVGRLACRFWRLGIDGQNERYGRLGQAGYRPPLGHLADDSFARVMSCQPLPFGPLGRASASFGLLGLDNLFDNLSRT